MEASFCMVALEEALSRYVASEIFNTDQGSQFTSLEFTSALKAAGVRISMDGKGRRVGNVMVERLWHSIKYKCVYLHAFETGSHAPQGIGKWLGYYNVPPHSNPDGRTTDELYAEIASAGPENALGLAPSRPAA
ncbi:integrase core domain-containing protein [Desulfocurvibacter africanus]|uniref:integrase core domain-containing protein n=1 Tax=Desulfocurvibacter africanus TaxID=873 RepID=UPI002FDAADF6